MGYSEYCCNSTQKVSQSKWRFRDYGTTGVEKLEEWKQLAVSGWKDGRTDGYEIDEFTAIY